MIGPYRDVNGNPSYRQEQGWMASRMPVLAAEPALADAKHLVGCLTRLRQTVRVAMSADDIIDLLRREVFTRAVVAVELTLDGEPVLARLSRLPMPRRIVALGPAGDPVSEVMALAAGAQAYLARPVSVEDLARALAVPAGTRT